MTRWSSPDPPRFQPGVGPMGDVLASFAVVFLAELGDKTQLVALTLAGRYSALKVLAVLGAALLLLQTLSVTAGALISEVVPEIGRASCRERWCQYGSFSGVAVSLK